MCVGHHTQIRRILLYRTGVFETEDMIFISSIPDTAHFLTTTN
jgi:hypothetical protein